jgi:hypothetical protein
MNIFAEFLYKNYQSLPTDWLMNDFIRKNPLIVLKPQKYVFEHEGEISSLPGKKQMRKVFK